MFLGGWWRMSGSIGFESFGCLPRRQDALKRPEEARRWELLAYVDVEFHISGIEAMFGFAQPSRISVNAFSEFQTLASGVSCKTPHW